MPRRPALPRRSAVAARRAALPRHTALATLAVVAALAAGGCGGDDDGVDLRSAPPPRTDAGGEAIVEVPGDRDSLGAQVALRSGCLACHRLGEAGNDAPGPDLTRVGARLRPAAIERALVRPSPPMPSFRSLPRNERAALVRYLASLR